MKFGLKLVFGVLILGACSFNGDYDFKVVGHPYPLITQLKPILDGDDLVIFTGDVVFHGCHDWPNYYDTIEGISDFHLTAGNHDSTKNCPENLDNIARSFESFMHKGDQFVLVDTVINQWNLDEKQINQLEEAFKVSARNRFVFFHNAIHWEDSKFDKTDNRWLPNSFEFYKAGTLRFETEVRPILESQANVTVFFGDYGNRNKGYHDETINGVRYIGAGLSAREKAQFSGYSYVTVSKGGVVELEHIILKCDIPASKRENIHTCEKHDLLSIQGPDQSLNLIGKLKFHQMTVVSSDDTGIELVASGKDPIIYLPDIELKDGVSYVLFVEFSSNVKSGARLYYSTSDKTKFPFSDHNSVRLPVKVGGNNLSFKFSSNNIGKRLRLDLIAGAGTVKITNLELKVQSE